MIEADLREGRLVEVWVPPKPSGEHLFMSWAKAQDHGGPHRRVVDWMLAEFEQSSE